MEKKRKMKIKCKDCDETEEFEDKEEAKDNDWHKIGDRWIALKEKQNIYYGFLMESSVDLV